MSRPKTRTLSVHGLLSDLGLVQIERETPFVKFDRFSVIRGDELGISPFLEGHSDVVQIVGGEIGYPRSQFVTALPRVNLGDERTAEEGKSKYLITS